MSALVPAKPLTVEQRMVLTRAARYLVTLSQQSDANLPAQVRERLVDQATRVFEVALEGTGLESAW